MFLKSHFVFIGCLFSSCAHTHTQEQYVFIHDAVLESVVCGNTQIPADDFRTTLEALKRISAPDSEETGLQAQYNVCWFTT